MPSTPINRCWNWALYSIALCGGMLICYHPTILSGFSRMQNDPGDTVLNHYLLEHSWKWLSDPNYVASFWSPPFYHPSSYTLTYSENLIGGAPLYWVLRLVCGQESAWQWWMLIVVALNFVAMAAVLRWFGVQPSLAALGGFIFAFGMARQGHLNHQHLLPQCFAPLVIWHFWRIVREPDRRSWFWFLLMTAWQLLASVHLGWFLFFALGIWFVVLVVADLSVLKRLKGFFVANPAFVISTTALWVAGLGLFFRTYYIGNETARRYYVDCLPYMPIFFDWLACPPHTLWDLHLYPLDEVSTHEKYLCPGLAVWGMALIALVWGNRNRRSADVGARPLARSSIVVCIVLIFATVRLGETASFWQIVHYIVPGANSMRAIGRVCLMVELFGLIGGLIAVQHLIESCRRCSMRPQLWIGLVCLLAAGEHVCFVRASFRREDFYGTAKQRATELTDADAAVVLQDRQSCVKSDDQEIMAVWSGSYARMPMLNGYSGRTPQGYFDSRTDGLAEIVRYLGANWRGRLLVVDPSNGRSRTYYDVRAGDDPVLRITPVP